MSGNGEAKYKGFLVGPTMHAVLEREVWSYPPEEQSERLRALVSRQRLEAEEYARQEIEALIAAAK